MVERLGSRSQARAYGSRKGTESISKCGGHKNIPNTQPLNLHEPHYVLHKDVICMSVSRLCSVNAADYQKMLPSLPFFINILLLSGTQVSQSARHPNIYRSDTFVDCSRYDGPPPCPPCRRCFCLTFWTHPQGITKEQPKDN